MERAGAWPHVTAGGNERRAIFRDDRDRARFRDLPGEAVGLFGWRLHAYVLMDTWAAGTPDGDSRRWAKRREEWTT
jgi:hypothetical protein